MIYDCLGAGQRVVQELYLGRSWREEPGLLEEMWRALSALRGVHELVLLLNEAAKLPLSAEERAQLVTLFADLEPKGGWTLIALDGFAEGPVPGRIQAFLTSLRRHFD